MRLVTEIRDFQMTIEYANDGDTDLLAPVLHLEGAGFSTIGLSSDEGTTSGATSARPSPSSWTKSSMSPMETRTNRF